MPLHRSVFSLRLAPLPRQTFPSPEYSLRCTTVRYTLWCARQREGQSMCILCLRFYEITSNELTADVFSFSNSRTFWTAVGVYLRAYMVVVTFGILTKVIAAFLGAAFLERTALTAVATAILPDCAIFIKYYILQYSLHRVFR